MPTEEQVVDEFLNHNVRLKQIIDSVGLRGNCIVIGELQKQSGLSTEELDFHVTLWDIDNYVAKPAPKTLCTRDAVRRIAEMLDTAML